MHPSHPFALPVAKVLQRSTPLCTHFKVEFVGGKAPFAHFELQASVSFAKGVKKLCLQAPTAGSGLKGLGQHAFLLVALLEKAGGGTQLQPCTAAVLPIAGAFGHQPFVKGSELHIAHTGNRTYYTAAAHAVVEAIGQLQEVLPAFALLPADPEFYRLHAVVAECLPVNLVETGLRMPEPLLLAAQTGVAAL